MNRKGQAVITEKVWHPVINEEGARFILEAAEIGMSFVFDNNLKLNLTNESSISEDNVQIRFRVHEGRIPEKRVGMKIFDSGAGWSFYRSGGKYILQDDSSESGASPETQVILEPDFKSGDVYIQNEYQAPVPDPLGGYPLTPVLMIILLSLGRGVLLHACGINDNGRGYLFSGNSTHGKSTIAQLWSESGATVLNDDRIIIREKKGQFWMYGTPWHGTFNEVSPHGLPIDKIFFLRHGKKNLVAPRKDAEAVSMLLTRSFPPMWDQDGMDYTLFLLDRIASRLSCHELQFLPDNNIIDFVRSI